MRLPHWWRGLKRKVLLDIQLSGCLACLFIKAIIMIEEPFESDDYMICFVLKVKLSMIQNVCIMQPLVVALDHQS